jgi:branched-chain amino acid aminotransferase
MPGIVRGVVLELAPGLGLEPAEYPLALEDLLAADTVFLTNSVRFGSPVMSLNGRPLGIKHDLVRKLNAAVGESIERECGYSLPVAG